MKDVDIVNFVDDSTPYMSANNIFNLVEILKDSGRFIFKWFTNNQMQGNSTRCHVL